MDRTERPVRLDKRVEKMDMDLKEHFADQQLYFSGALAGVEKRLGARIDEVDKRLGARIDRLGARIDGVETSLGSRIDKLDRDMRAAFAGMDAKLSILIERSGALGGTRRSRRR